jgi:hypothetical protein
MRRNILVPLFAMIESLISVCWVAVVTLSPWNNLSLNIEFQPERLPIRQVFQALGVNQIEVVPDLLILLY